MAASKQFLATLAKKKKQFTKARKAKPSAFGIPEIDNGTYVARLSASIATRGDENTIVVGPTKRNKLPSMIYRVVSKF